MKFLDIYNQDKHLLNKHINVFKSIFKESNFILGKQVIMFEEYFAKFSDSKFAVGCSNGSDALYLAIKSLNLPKKSEVLVPAMTYCSTIFAIIHNNLKPVLVDIEYNSSNISIKEIKKKINKKTKLILPVHLYGNICDVGKIKKIVGKKIKVIEDSSQAHGAFDCYNCKNKNREKNKCCKKGYKIGRYSDMSCYSLYPGKNLGAYGDAGIITTNYSKYKSKIKEIQNLGSKKKFYHSEIGNNHRLDTLQAAFLINKLPYLNRLNKKRQEIASFYNKHINNPKIKKLIYSKGSVYHQYVIRVDEITKFSNFLTKNKIPFGRHYPFAIHQLSCFKKKFGNQKYKIAEDLAKKCISLPINPLLKKKEIKKIIKIINEF